MKKNRTTLLAPFFSSMTILSFKKKDKDGGLAGTSASMSEASMSGGSLSLNELGGDIVSLSGLGQSDDSPESLSSSLLSMSGAGQGDGRLQELEASLNDIKKNSETADLAARAMKGDIDAMKGDLSHINESIKSLLNVYEAVTRQYNPFVENNAPEPMTAGINGGQVADDLLANNGQLGSMSEMNSNKIEGLGRGEPFDDDGPLDRVVKPDDDFVDTYPLITGIHRRDSINGRSEHMMERGALNNNPIRASAPAVEAVRFEDIYPLEQARRLIDYQMGKICRDRASGKEIALADRRALDLWIGEFRRLGGI